MGYNTLIHTETIMTHKELLRDLQSLTEDQLNMDVVIEKNYGLYSISSKLDVELRYAGQEDDDFGLDQPIIRF